MSDRTEKIVAVTLLVLTGILLAHEMRSLSFFPEPNGLRWFGDESWLMSEAREQMATGTVRYPLAIGSTLEFGKGLVLSMTWLSSALYGLPVLIAGSDPITVGRVVTAVLSVFVLFALFASARSLGASRCMALFSVFLFVSTRAFLFSSHSARPDMLAGGIALAFVAILTKWSYAERERSGVWWTAYGAIVMFLAVSSSIHLITLLFPVALFFAWRLGAFRRVGFMAATVLGAGGVLAALILIYYLTTGNLRLFSVSSGPVQFNDVLSSIPILRPFSRSVQLANLTIRAKQFAAEAAPLFLLLLIVPFVWKRNRSHTLTVAIVIVFLSWFFLQGAEINYLAHVLPLLFLALAIALTRLLSYSRWLLLPIVAIGIAFGFTGWRDAARACSNASNIDRSNANAVESLKAAIAARWHFAQKPLVLTEPPVLDRLANDTSLRVMTDHFISFPSIPVSLDTFLMREHVNFIVLYNSPSYPKNRPVNDPFYRNVRRSSTLISEAIGISGDVGRDYFDRSYLRDTLLLFEVSP